MQSSIALAIGMLDAPFTSSAPSATNHVALPFTPHSLSSVDRSTPVHSALLVMPCVSCTVLARRDDRLPAHSMKCRRVTDGRRFRSSTVKVSGRSTRPWIISVCCRGIDIRQERAARRRVVVERGRRDDPDLILQRGRDVKRQAEVVGRRPAAVRDAGRGDVLRPPRRRQSRRPCSPLIIGGWRLRRVLVLLRRARALQHPG